MSKAEQSRPKTEAIKHKLTYTHACAQILIYTHGIIIITELPATTTTTTQLLDLKTKNVNKDHPGNNTCISD